MRTACHSNHHPTMTTQTPPKRSRGRPPGTTKGPRALVHARVSPSTAAWLLHSQPTARSIHHAATLILDQLALAATHTPDHP